jgi:alkylation response protein AidB-like acyl-CoA dehydrogenase
VWRTKAPFINRLKATLFASERTVDVTNLAIQVMGGHRDRRDYVVERPFRDPRRLMLHLKTFEWLCQHFAKAVIGLCDGQHQEDGL